MHPRQAPCGHCTPQTVRQWVAGGNCRKMHNRLKFACFQLGRLNRAGGTSATPIPPPPAFPTASECPPTDFTARLNRFVTALSLPPECPPLSPPHPTPPNPTSHIPHPAQKGHTVAEELQAQLECEGLRAHEALMRHVSKHLHLRTSAMDSRSSTPQRPKGQSEEGLPLLLTGVAKVFLKGLLCCIAVGG